MGFGVGVESVVGKGISVLKGIWVLALVFEVVGVVVVISIAGI